MSRKFALIIGNTEYIDPGLARLNAPGKDAKDFAEVLTDPEICGFDDVAVLLNEPEHIIRGAIDDLFNQKKSDDLLVLYFSGHGVRDEAGSLYLAVHNTIRTRLRSTAIKSDYIREAIDQSLSDRQVLILDCCNSGAFALGTKAATGMSLGTASAFEGTGYGRVVLTASDATQLAWEGDRILGETENSLFTHFLIRGLRGDADKDRDGKITVDDLYVYAYDEIITRTRKQTPRKWSYKQQGEIPLRQLSDAQKEQKRLLELAEQNRRKAEEAEQLALINAEREAAEKRTEELRISRETAEAGARAASERFAQEKAKLELIEHDIEQQKAARESLQKTYEQGLEKTAERPRLPALNKYWAGLAGVIALVFISFGAYSLLSNRNTPGPIGQAISTTGSGIGQLFSTPTANLTEQDAPLGNTGSAPVSLTPQAINLVLVEEPISLAGSPVTVPTAAIDMQNATAVTQLARWGKGYVNDLKYSQDGKTIALATTIGIYLLDATNLNPIQFISTLYDIRGIAYSLDGKTITGISSSGDILKYQPEDGAFIAGTKGFFTFVRAVSFSPDGSMVALSGNALINKGGNKIFLMNLSDGKLIRILQPEDSTGRDVESSKFSSDGKLLISFTREAIFLWDPNTGELINKYLVEESYRNEVVFSPDNKLFAFINSNDSSIRIMKTEDGTLVQTLEGHNSLPFALTFSPDGKSVYYSLGDGAIRVREIESGDLMYTVKAHDQYISHILFSPDGNFFVSTSNDSALSLRTANGTELTRIAGFTEGVNNCSLSSDDKLLAVGTDPVRILQMSDGNIWKDLPSGDNWPYIPMFLSQSQKIAVSSSSNGLQIWSFENGDFIKTTDTYLYPDNYGAISPNDQYIAVDNSDGKIELYGLDSTPGFSQQKPFLEGHTDAISGLTFSPDSKILASSSEDKTVRLWNTFDGTLLRVIENHLDFVNDVVFAPDGKSLATSSGDGTIIIQKVEDGTVIRTIEMPANDTPYKLAFSPDGRVLASSNYPVDAIKLWDASTGQLLQTLLGHTSSAEKLIFTSDGRILVSCSYDGTIRLWGVKP